MGMKGLGRVFDIAPVLQGVNLATGANAGLVVSLENAGGVTFVFFKDQGTAGDDPVVTLRESQGGTGATGTNEQDLATITEWYSKTDTGGSALGGDETWTKFTQAAAASIDFDNASAEKGASAEDEALVAIYVDADDLSDGYTHVTLDIADVGDNAQIGAVIAILHDLKVQRSPENLAATQ